MKPHLQTNGLSADAAWPWAGGVRDSITSTTPSAWVRRRGERFVAWGSVVGWLTSAATFVAGMPALKAAGLPVPSFVYFGEVADAFGWPFLVGDSAQVIAYRMDGKECGRAPVDEAMGPALNYRVEVAMTESRGAAYASYAVRSGEKINFVLEADGARYPVTMPSNLEPVGRPGGQSRQDLALGTDADRDGLPDEWESWLMLASGGGLGSNTDISPLEDFDGDGATNGEEFLAGTDPAWDEDLPLLEAVRYDAVGRQVSVAVLTLPGRTYRILSATRLEGDGSGWSVRPFGRTPSAEPKEEYWRGDGQLTWIYLPLAESGSLFLKLEVL